MNPKHILITGASGLIGLRLTEKLVQAGHQVSHVSRSESSSPYRTFLWDVKKFKMESGAFDQVDAVIHLAGAGIADKPWSELRKQEILESRTLSTKLLRETMEREGAVKVFLAASAMGYYGLHDHSQVFSEDDPPGQDFLAQVTRQWEQEIDQVRSLGVRVVKFRTSVVLSKEGGALASMAKPIRWYVGAPLGKGSQAVSWIHVDDLCNMYIQALENEGMSGAYNAAAPQIVSNQELTEQIATILQRPLILPSVPAFVLRALLGEMADLVLKGCAVSSRRIREAGFTFSFERLSEALQQIFLSKDSCKRGKSP